MRSTRERTVTFIIGVLAVTAFSVTSVVAMVWVNGLKFDPVTRNFELTTIVAVEDSVSEAEIYLNGELVSKRAPFEQRSLSAGNYTLSIKKEGYHEFTKTFQLRSGELGLVKDGELVLIATRPKVEIISSPPPLPRFFTTEESGLTVTNGELFDGTNLVTRFSGEPLSVRRYKKGFVYLTASEVRFFSPVNNQDELLYARAESDLVALAVTNGAIVVGTKEIITETGSDITFITIYPEVLAANAV